MAVPSHPSAQPSIVYPESDGLPMAGGTRRYELMVTLRENLDCLLDGFVAANLFWYPVEGDPKVVQAPDVFACVGRPKGHRRSYKQWEEAGSPHRSCSRSERVEHLAADAQKGGLLRSLRRARVGSGQRCPALSVSAPLGGLFRPLLRARRDHATVALSRCIRGSTEGGAEGTGAGGAVRPAGWNWQAVLIESRELYVLDPESGQVTGWVASEDGPSVDILPTGEWTSPILEVRLVRGEPGEGPRFYLPDGSPFLTFGELRIRAEQAESRADRLARRLQELGVDPNDV